MANDIIKAISELLENHCPVSFAKQFMKLITGCEISSNSIRKLRETVLIRKYDKKIMNLQQKL